MSWWRMFFAVGSQEWLCGAKADTQPTFVRGVFSNPQSFFCADFTRLWTRLPKALRIPVCRRCGGHTAVVGTAAGQSDQRRKGRSTPNQQLS